MSGRYFDVNCQNCSNPTDPNFSSQIGAGYVELHFIEPGKPNQNAFVESFNGRMRDECLNENWFVDLDDAEKTVADWCHDYNHNRGRKVAGRKTPAEVAAEARSAGLQSPPAPTALRIVERLLRDRPSKGNRTLSVG